MFCIARAQQKGHQEPFPAVILDYQDPANDDAYEKPPAVRFSTHVSSYQRLGMLPMVVLVHYPDSAQPYAINGVISWNEEEGFIFRSSETEGWSLDFKACTEQNKRTKELAEIKGLPTNAPVLSKHSERPLMKIERSIVGAFYSNGPVDGEKLGRQWIAALTLIHNLSMGRTMRCLRFKSEMLKRFVIEDEERNNEFVIWWPCSKPTSLQGFIRQLWITKTMSAQAQNALQMLKPFHVGFYRCEVSDNMIFLDDESNVPYEYLHRPSSKALFSPKTLRGKIIVQATVWLQLIPSSTEPSHLESVKQEENNVGLFLLPRRMVGLSANVGVERSENVEFSFELWKQHIGTQVCDKVNIEKLTCEAWENAKSMLVLHMEKFDDDN